MSGWTASMTAGSVGDMVIDNRVRRSVSLRVLCLALATAVLGQHWLAELVDLPRVRTAATVFVAVCVQALPFLLLGALISAAIAALVPADALRRALPARTRWAVPAAGLAGALLPGCECASVPIAGRLMARRVPPSVALTFLLAAPAVNPVVVVATAMAFPHQPLFVLARFAGSLCTALAMGWLWARFGRAEWITARAGPAPPRGSAGLGRLAAFVDAMRVDLLRGGGFLVVGAVLVATLNVLLPASWWQQLSDQPVLAVPALALLAVVLALCSEADAFVASAFRALPAMSKLAFLIVGPAVDIKLIAMQAGSFGWRFAARFAPVTFVVAVASAVLVATVMVRGS